MNLAMVNGELLPVPPVLGGAIEHTLFETVRSLGRSGMSVISAWARELDGIDLDPASTFYHVDLQEQEQRVLRALSGNLPAGLEDGVAARAFYYLNGVSDLLSQLDPDVIQVHNRPDFMPFLLRQFPQKRHILYMHNDPGYWEEKLRVSVAGIHKLVFVSRFLAQDFIRKFPNQASKAVVVYNSVDTNRWHPRLKTDSRTNAVRQQYNLPEGRTVLFVGRTVAPKGIQCLLPAMDLVRRSMPGVKLVIAGSPMFGAVHSNSFLEELKKIAGLMGDTVVFTGYVERDQTPYLYAAADVVVTPSVWHEPFGKVVVEAMASGVPVVGSGFGAIPEILQDGVTGLLVRNPADVQGLAGKILDLLSDLARRKTMGMEARRRAVARFSMPVRMARLQEFYASLETGGDMQDRLMSLGNSVEPSTAVHA